MPSGVGTADEGPGREAARIPPSAHHTPASLLRMYQFETTQPGETGRKPNLIKIQTAKKPAGLSFYWSDPTAGC